LASLFFGVIHAILQQSISATVVGMVIGYIAIKTGSLLPAVLYHFTHNTLTLLMSRIDAATVESHPALQLVFRRFEDQGQVTWMYDPMFAAIALTLATAIALWYKSLPYRRTREEDLQQALSEQDFGSRFSAKPI
jgi:sodium transport system permease protein